MENNDEIQQYVEEIVTDYFDLSVSDYEVLHEGSSQINPTLDDPGSPAEPAMYSVDLEESWDLGEMGKFEAEDILVEPHLSETDVLNSDLKPFTIKFEDLDVPDTGDVIDVMIRINPKGISKKGDSFLLDFTWDQE